MQQQDTLLRTIHEAKAHYRKMADAFDPPTPRKVEAWLERLDETVQAMDAAAVVLSHIEQAISAHHGTEKWVWAMEIAYAPNDAAGYARVVEYYARLDSITQL